MARNKTFNRRNVLIIVTVVIAAAILLTGRLAYLMIAKSADYAKRAEELHERERAIKAERGIIYDRNGVVLADNKPVSTISVIHSQITDPEKVIKLLSENLGLSEAYIKKRVEKNSSIERIKSNVEKTVADTIREYDLDGVMVDEDYKRYYPYGDLASKVIGFTGSDNQGIIGLEVQYDNYLKGTDGTILTLTTAYGVEIENAAEDRIEPVAGKDLYTSIDVNIQKYAEQAALKVLEAKQANNVKLILMNPQNGEIYACVNVPEFNLNDPYTLTDSALNGLDSSTLTEKQKNDLLNNMWRNASISDTYEPGSTFKVVTATAALEEKVVKLTDRFYCPGYKIVEDRRIRCHKVGGHGSEDFIDGIKNSCNPVFMEIGARVGVTNMYKYFGRLGLMRKTGVDLPGEAKSIMHKPENVGAVELATMSFGQSFQITPLQLLVAASSIVNGGKIVTPHFGVEIKNKDGSIVKTLKYKEEAGAVSKETSDLMKQLLETVVSEGTGNRAYLAGYHIGGKTATSEKLPRSSNKYISSFLGFAPADNPQIIGIILIDEPVGIYYGGTIAAPVVAEVYEDVLPYLGIQPQYTEEEIKKNNIGTMIMPDLIGMTKAEVKKMLKDYTFKEVYYDGEGDKVKSQFPLQGEEINNNSNLILYME
ncbi:penicillin-binding transpeptidase domain-containing protein [Anaerocolumna xylanovorans]|uniref:Stage V sporulation protein D (Sporulation-specific penicillin-binding protein) n=1 Tax=Anaerocolumna xylanovorans DSM 12503 TaxID=1121345 RepID=A0A1M7YBF2_9FIRM|nr:penicillin-binding transpeptidase domain-containing protein [Anaerocolumna xylanovorans]SHO49957.1 stage V sporulation protein D (sporulation-specific penicillin-binding protein) [Anaerocolumna xylanovorans DSM 12503]